MASKGKGIMEESGKGKDKRGVKRKSSRDVLQFFEEAAVDFDDADEFSEVNIDDLFDDDDEDFLNDYNEVLKDRGEPGKSQQVPFMPKEEELSGDELEKMLEERYRKDSGYVRYAEDDYDTKRSVDRSFLIHSVVEPFIWKVKCKVGREKKVVFCLMQKFVDLKVLGTKLHIISAFTVEHIKGAVFIEAEKQSDVSEACHQLADVYYTLVTQVPTNEVGKLLNVRRKYNEVKEGTWARVKNGIYRGDLAQVVAVNNERKRATVKLIPRVDLQALTVKYGGGATVKRTKSVPVARLISSSELEEFRPLMQYRRDRDTGKVFEFLDSLMFKDGFLYKKISIDSLAFWDVNPSEDEMQKFTLPCRDDSDNVEWLSQLYGEKKKSSVKINTKTGKGECSSGSSEQSSFELHDLVLFGKKDFGMIIGVEKDENYKILKDGPEGPVTVTLGQKDLKYLPLEKKFTALDHCMKTISINDTVRILDGPVKGKKGIVKQIYRGILFLYDENDFDNAYSCTKSQKSEKVKLPVSAYHGKDEEAPSTFEDVPSSPKSPLSPKKPWQMRENHPNDQGDKGSVFTVGQSLRIRVGPLKGHLCRVVGVRYSDVTVKLDSRQKVLTVKREHLSEVGAKSTTSLMSNDQELGSSFKPFDLLGPDTSANDWLQGTSGAADGDGWNVQPSTERSTWPAFGSLGSSVQVGTVATAPSGSVDNDSGKDDAGWLSKVDGIQNSDRVGGWGTSDSVVGASSVTGASSSWEKAKVSVEDHGGSWAVSGSSSGQGLPDNRAAQTWGQKVNVDFSSKGKHLEDAGGWDNLVSSANAGSSGWGKQKACGPTAMFGESTESLEKSSSKLSTGSWGEAKGISDPAEDSFGKAAGNLGCKNNFSEDNEWKSTAVVSTSQGGAWAVKQTGWGQPQGENASGGWKNKDSCSGSKEQHNSWNSPASDGKGWSKGSGDWARSQEEHTAGGGWRSKKDDSQGGTDSWGQFKNFENDQGFNGGRGSGGRRGRGRDQYGRGRGRGRLINDGQDEFSSGNKHWNKNEVGSTLGSWTGGNGGVSSLEMNSSGTAWNGASSGLGQTSWEKGKSLVVDGASSDKVPQLQDASAAIPVNGGSEDPWGKAADNTSSKSSGGSWGATSKWGHSSEGNAADGWNAGGSNSNAWKRGGDVCHAKSWDTKSGNDGGSWSKPAGNDSWEQSRNSENDYGSGLGRGSDGRGRGSFGRGRFQSGRRGGRSTGGGQFSSWKNEGQGGSSWGNSSGQNGGNSWSKGQISGGEGENKQTNVGDRASWGGRSSNSSGSWGKAWVRNEKGEDQEDNESSEFKSSVSSRGGSSWGKFQSSGSGGVGSSWGNPQSGGSGGVSAWGNAPGGSGGGSSWGKSASDESQKPSEGGSTWGNPESGGSGEVSAWGKSQPGGSGGGSSWGKSASDVSQKPSEGGSSWGNQESGSSGVKAWDNAQPGGSGGGSSWGKSASDVSQKPSGGGSSWGNPQSGGSGGVSAWGNVQPGGSGGGSSWGKSASGESQKQSEGGPSLGGGSSDQSSWGKSSGSNDNGQDGNKSWNSGQGGSSWGNAKSGGVGGGWGN